MFTRFRLMAALVLTSVGGWIGYERVEWFRSQVEQAQPHFDRLVDLVHGVVDKCRDNPVPIYVAVAWFLFTMVYHWAKGKSFRESVEVAATRVKVVEQPATTTQAETVSPVVLEAQQKLLSHQLKGEAIAITDRLKKLPELMKKAEVEVCHRQKQETEAKSVHTVAFKNLSDASKNLAKLRAEHFESINKLAAIETELERQKARA